MLFMLGFISDISFFFVSGKFMLCAEISLEVSSLPVFGSLSDNTRSSVFRLL